MLAAHIVSPFADQLLVLIVLNHFRATPRALQHLEFIMPFLFVAHIIIVANFSELI